MTDRAAELAALYVAGRLDHQVDYYERTCKEYSAAASQVVALSGVLVIVGAVGGALAALDVADLRTTWGLLAAIAPALGIALAAYDGLYGFERNAKLYDDAERALRRLPRPPDDPTALTAWCEQVEGILRREQGQWGQLSAEADRAAGA